MKLLLLFALFSAGLFAQTQPNCNNRALISVTASGTTTVIPAASGLAVHVCSVSFSDSTAVNVAFFSVGTGGAAITGTYQNVSTFAYNFQGSLSTPTGLGFGINVSATTTLGGFVSYYLDKQ